MSAIEKFLKMKQELLELFSEEELKEELERRKRQPAKAVLHLLGLPEPADIKHLSKRYGSLRR